LLIDIKLSYPCQVFEKMQPKNLIVGGCTFPNINPTSIMLKKTNYLILIVSILLYVNHSIAQQWGLYTLYGLQNQTTTYLIDTNNNNYHTWTHPSTAKTGYGSYLLPGGKLVRSVANQGNPIGMGGGLTGRVQIVEWDGTVTWDYTYSTSSYCLHHDIHPMPNGNILMIAYDVKSAADLVAAGGDTSMVVWSEKIIEVKPTGPTTGDIVWEWKVWDHLVQNYNSNASNYAASIIDHPELLNINYGLKKDWLHMNGLDYNPILDQIAWSSHNWNQWFIIDHSTTTAEAASHSGGNSGKGGDILYRYGNPGSYGAPGSTVLNVTHDVHWIPEGVPNAGRLVGFNNRGVSNNQSSVDQIILPTVSNYNYAYTSGTAYLPLTYTERHACNGYSSNMSNSQQLPNGNMLVCMATAGNIYEIDAAGTTIWTMSVQGNVPQAYRYDACYVNNPAPAMPSITANSNTLTCSQAETYQWYYNGQLINGATQQTYEATQSGVYVVRITDANGCMYSYSTGYKHTAAAVSNEDLDKQWGQISLFPNPATGNFTIEGLSVFNTYVVTITDMSGRTVQQTNASRINLNDAPDGMYLLRIDVQGLKPFFQKIIIQH
jgi:hypothetical protein